MINFIITWLAASVFCFHHEWVACLSFVKCLPVGTNKRCPGYPSPTCSVCSARCARSLIALTSCPCPPTLRPKCRPPPSNSPNNSSFKRSASTATEPGSASRWKRRASSLWRQRETTARAAPWSLEEMRGPWITSQQRRRFVLLFYFYFFCTTGRRKGLKRCASERLRKLESQKFWKNLQINTKHYMQINYWKVDRLIFYLYYVLTASLVVCHEDVAFASTWLLHHVWRFLSHSTLGTDPDQFHLKLFVLHSPARSPSSRRTHRSRTFSCRAAIGGSVFLALKQLSKLEEILPNNRQYRNPSCHTAAAVQSSTCCYCAAFW